LNSELGGVLFKKIFHKCFYYNRIFSHLFIYLSIYITLWKIFKSYQIENIKIFRFKKWHHGFLYLTAFHKDKKLFIKIDTNYLLIENEENFYQLFTKELNDHLIPLNFCYYSDRFQLMVTDFLECKELTVNDLNEENLNTILSILNVIAFKKIVHRDINLNNFILYKNTIKIIDFSFSIDLDGSIFKELNLSSIDNIKTLKGLNEGFKPGIYTWNDFYSMYKIIHDNKLTLDSNIFEIYLEKFKKRLPSVSYKVEKINA
jgi:serine/threonine protein kinase